MRPGQELYEDLAKVRSLLVSSPLVGSLEETRAPLERAIEALRAGLQEAEPVSDDMRHRLQREVAEIGQLMGGLGQWLTAHGALTPTYNRQAEFEMETGGGLTVDG